MICNTHSRRKRWFIWSFLAALATPTQAAATASKEQLYQRGTQLISTKQYTKAHRVFASLLTRFVHEQQALRPSSRAWQQMQVGQCGSLLQLASLSWKLGKQRTSCRYHKTAQTRYARISQRWRKQLAHSPLGRQLLHSKQRLQTQCKLIPSQLHLKTTPTHANIFTRLRDTWKPVSSPIKTTHPTLTLKIQAPGFVTQQLTTPPIPQWGTLHIAISLKQAPPTRQGPATQPAIAKRSAAKLTPGRPRPVTRTVSIPGTIPPKIARIPPRTTQPPLPPPAPFYKTWWFWTVTGVVVGGSAALIAVVVNQNQSKQLFADPDPNKPYRLW